MKKYIVLALFLGLISVPVFVSAQSVTIDQIVAFLRANPNVLEQVLRLINQNNNQGNGGWCHDFNTDMETGSQAELEVDGLHVALKGAGFSTGSDSGNIAVFGENTAAAVVQFQAKYGIRQTGYVGPITRGKLNQLYGCNNKVFITPSALETAKVGGNYYQHIIVHGITGNITWNITSGSLSPGMGWNPDPLPLAACGPGVDCNFSGPMGISIVGPATTAGTYTFTVQATNGTQTARQTYTLRVLPVGNNAGAPVISGVSGPTTLAVGQTGTWTVQASDPQNDQLWYFVDWGDRVLYDYGGLSANGVPSDFRQTTTFSHSYAIAGTYTVKFLVQDTAGHQAQTSISVRVGPTTQPGITVTSPNGGEQWVANSVQDIKWTNTPGTLCPTCNLSADWDKVYLYLDRLPPGCPGPQSVCLAIYMGPPFVLDKNISSSAAYHWIVGTDIVNNAIPAGTYVVRICPTGSQTNCDSSDQSFTITR